MESAKPVRSTIRIRDLTCSIPVCIIAVLVLALAKTDGVQKLGLMMALLFAFAFDWFTARIEQMEGQMRELSHLSAETLVAAGDVMNELRSTKLIRVDVKD